jgi:hypothetical protein
MRINVHGSDARFYCFIKGLRRPRNFTIAVECSAMQGHAKRRSYIFVYGCASINRLAELLHRTLATCMPIRKAISISVNRDSPRHMTVLPSDALPVRTRSPPTPASWIKNHWHHVKTNKRCAIRIEKAVD